jgi:ribonuclease P protein component
MVVHLLVSQSECTQSECTQSECTQSGPAVAPMVGFVVSKAVGPAVTRNLVKRRLRHLARERVASLPADGMLVVRALAPAALASYDELAHELDRCLDRCQAKATVPTSLSANTEVDQ